MCCSVGFARSLGLALLPLAICCILANLLLLFPMGEITYVKQERLASFIWYFGGLGGGGIVVSKRMISREMLVSSGIVSHVLEFWDNPSKSCVLATSEVAGGKSSLVRVSLLRV